VDQNLNVRDIRELPKAGHVELDPGFPDRYGWLTCMRKQLRFRDLISCKICKDLGIGIGFGDRLCIRENLFGLLIHWVTPFLSLGYLLLFAAARRSEP